MNGHKVQERETALRQVRDRDRSQSLSDMRQQTNPRALKDQSSSDLKLQIERTGSQLAYAALQKAREPAYREPSPPVPAIRRKLEEGVMERPGEESYRATKYETPQSKGYRELSEYRLPNNADKKGTRQHPYEDLNPSSSIPTSELAPFLRTSHVLSPEKATQDAPISRESSDVGRARQIFLSNQNPAIFGLLQFSDYYLLN